MNDNSFQFGEDNFFLRVGGEGYGIDWAHKVCKVFCFNMGLILGSEYECGSCLQG